MLRELALASGAALIVGGASCRASDTALQSAKVDSAGLAISNLKTSIQLPDRQLGTADDINSWQIK